MEYKIEAENLYKVYPLKVSKIKRILSMFIPDKTKRGMHKALKDVSFKVEGGDSIGIIGLNGSGKSTLSNLLANVTTPSRGKVSINGRSSLIAIAAGLDPNLSGEENIRMKCIMHGMTQKETEAQYDDIVRFSELGDFIYQPIKSYSSGMKSRLGFSIAIHTDPDVLIVDEALSVGDQTFSNKCITKLKEFQEEGKTIFFVSHSISEIKKMCNKTMWLHYGELLDYDETEKVLNKYNKFITEYHKMEKDSQIEYKNKMVSSQYTNTFEYQQEKNNTREFLSYWITLSVSFILFTIAILNQIGLV